MLLQVQPRREVGLEEVQTPTSCPTPSSVGPNLPHQPRGSSSASWGEGSGG